MLQHAHGILCHNGLIVALERHKVCNGNCRDEDTGGMGGGMAWHSLQLHRHIQQLFRSGIRLIQFPQVSPVLTLHGLGNGISGVDGLSNFVAESVGNPHRPSGIPHCATGFH